MEIEHEEQYKGFTIKIYHDDTAESPRYKENLGTITAWHKNYSLSDLSDGLHNYDVDTFVKEVINSPNVISLPLYMYEHSGIALNTTGFTCRWDSGQVGWIHVDKDKIRKEYSWLFAKPFKRITKKIRDKVKSVLRSEIDTYSKYLNGEVYRYDVEDKEGECIDSCGGFFGDYDDEYMLQCARDAIDQERKSYKETEQLPLLAAVGLLKGDEA